jgi:hypothetical protein
VRAQAVRAEIERLLHQAPSRPFVLTLESGERVPIGHPENIAFDPGPEGSPDFYIVAGRLRLFSTFEAVSSVTLLEAAEAEDSHDEEKVA